MPLCKRRLPYTYVHVAPFIDSPVDFEFPRRSRRNSLFISFPILSNEAVNLTPVHFYTHQPTDTTIGDQEFLDSRSVNGFYCARVARCSFLLLASVE